MADRPKCPSCGKELTRVDDLKINSFPNYRLGLQKEVFGEYTYFLFHRNCGHIFKVR